MCTLSLAFVKAESVFNMVMMYHVLVPSLVNHNLDQYLDSL